MGKVRAGRPRDGKPRDGKPRAGWTKPLPGWPTWPPSAWNMSQAMALTMKDMMTDMKVLMMLTIAMDRTKTG